MPREPSFVVNRGLGRPRSVDPNAAGRLGSAAAGGVRRELASMLAEASGASLSDATAVVKRLAIPQDGSRIDVTRIVKAAISGGVLGGPMAAAARTLVRDGSFDRLAIDPSTMRGVRGVEREAVLKASAARLGELADIPAGALNKLSFPEELIMPEALQGLRLTNDKRDLLGTIGAIHFGTGQDVRVTEALIREAKSLQELAGIPLAQLAARLEAAIPGHGLGVAVDVNARLTEAFPCAALMAALPNPSVAEIETALGSGRKRLETLESLFPGVFDDLGGRGSRRAKAREARRRIDALRALVAAEPGVDFLRTDLTAVGRSDRRGRLIPEDWMFRFWEHYQILFRLAGTVPAAVALSKQGVRSARDAVENEKVPEAIRRRARQIVGEIANVALSIAQVDELPGPVNNQSGKLKDNLGASYSMLFQQGGCDCEHCRSVLSPAAYFVDLMKYAGEVEKRAKVSGSVYRLWARRRDLWTVTLDCDATTQTVPYLDLVNEVLEETYTRRASGLDALAQAASRHDRFDWPKTPRIPEVDAYLELLEIGRAGVVGMLASQDSGLARRLAASRLGIDEVTADAIVSEASQAQLRRLFHTVTLSASGGTLRALPLPELLHSIPATRQELVDWLATSYVQGGSGVRIRARRSTAAAPQNDIEEVVDATWDVLRRLARMIRLGRALKVGAKDGWTVAELDFLLSRFGEDSLEVAGGVVELRRQLEFSVEELLAFETTLPETSLRPDKKPLAGRVFGASAGSLIRTLPSYGEARVRLAAALGVEPETIGVLGRALEEAGVFDPSRASMTKTELARFYRHARLAKGLGVKIEQLLDLCALADVGSIATLADAVAVVTLAGWLKGAGIAPDVARRAVEPDTVSEDTVAPLFDELPSADISVRDELVGALADAWSKSRDDVAALIQRLREIQTGDPGEEDWSDERYRGSILDKTGADWRALKVHLERLRILRDAVGAAGPGLIYAEHVAAWTPSETVDRALFSGTPTVRAQAKNLVEAVRTKVLAESVRRNLARAWSVAVADVVDLERVLDDPEWDDEQLAHHVSSSSASAAGNARRSKLLAQVARLDALRGVVPEALLARAEEGGTSLLSAFREETGVDRVVDSQLIDALVVLSRSLPIWQRLATARGDDFHAALRAFDPNDMATASAVTGDAIEELDALTSSDWPGLSSDPLVALSELAQRLGLAGALGLGGNQLSVLARIGKQPSDPTAPGRSDVATVAEALRATLTSLDTDRHEERMKEIAGIHREALRDVYVGLLSDPELAPTEVVQARGADAWFEYLLIDVARGGCAETTRVATAISSVQMYLHRINDGDELRVQDDLDALPSAADRRKRKRVGPDNIKDYEWAYRAAYREWELARRVYLYPEKHLDPELRDDQTELYRELMEALKKQQADSQTVLRLLQDYLRKFRQLASLQPTGAFSTGTTAGDQVLISSATAEDPPTHYLQTYTPSTRRWSECEKVDVAIPSRAVSPVLDGGQLRLFWLTKNTRAVTRFTSGNSRLVAYRHPVSFQFVDRLRGTRWSQAQPLDIDFGPLGYGLENLVLDRFTKNQKISDALSAVSGTETKEQKLTVKVSELKGVPGLSIRAWWLYSGVEKHEDFPFDADLGKAIIEDLFDRHGKDRWGIPNAMEEALFLVTVVSLLAAKQKATVTISASGDGDITATVEPVTFDRGDGFKAMLFQAPEPIPLTDFPTQIRSQVEVDLGVEGERDRPLPIFDTENHYEPVETYTLDRFGWGRPFPTPNPEQGLLLEVPGSIISDVNRFRSFRVNFVTRETRLLDKRFSDPVGAPWLRLSESLEGVDVYAPTAPKAYRWFDGQDTFASREWFADPRAIERANDLLLEHTGAEPPDSLRTPLARVLTNMNVLDDARCTVVNGATTDLVFTVDGTSYVVRRLAQGAELTRPRESRAGENDGYDPKLEHHYEVLRLGSSLADRIAEAFSVDLERGYSLEEQQALAEADNPFELATAAGSDRTLVGELDFHGPMGVYLREIYFHIPYAVAVHFNREGRYEEAQRWFEFLFDPSAPDNGDGDQERVWRSRYLRGAGDAGVRDLFSRDGSAAESLERDPFNPFSVARMRRAAFQKAVVIRYIRNIVDRADTLFRQFQREPLEAALRLYLRARALLGDRPYRVGDCGETGGTTFREIGERPAGADAMLLEIERKLATTATARHLQTPRRRQLDFMQLKHKSAVDLEGRKVRSMPSVDIATLSPYVGVRAEAERRTHVPVAPKFMPAASLFEPKKRSWRGVARHYYGGARMEAGRGSVRGAARAPLGLLDQLTALAGPRPAFCIPASEEIDELWDLLDDRLYNLRNCRTIDGDLRPMPAFAPPLELSDLIRRMGGAQAGLTAAEALGAAEVPAYRFTYLLEKAKAAASEVRSLGAAFQTAKERYDAESLSQLRAEHEVALLDINKRARKLELESAEEGLSGLLKRKALVQYRLGYFEQLLQTGLIGPEIQQQQSSEAARNLRLVASGHDLAASIIHLIPQIGSFFAMKFGGLEIGSSVSKFGDLMKAAAGIAETVASSAALEASWDRRAEGWEHQIETASLELEALESQIESARLRIQISNDALAAHERQLEQSQAVRDYQRDKFSNDGLYGWLEGELRQLHREAYEGAVRIASMAVRALEHELGIEYEPGIDFEWSGMYAGLLSGEKLAAQLRRLEEFHLRENKRQLEITHPISFSVFAPDKLRQLQDDGKASFTVRREMLDLLYPGHYHRILRDVRVTIPAVTGPYTNVAAELKLDSSQVYPDAAGDAGRVVSRTAADRMATSNARADNGRVVLTFGNEFLTYFEGAGAVSVWELQLPSAVRSFDYSTISDVILELTYTAKAGSEDGRKAAEDRVLGWLQSTPQLRIISLRSEFPDVLAELKRGDSPTVDLVPEMFPYHALNPDPGAAAPFSVTGVEPGDATQLNVTRTGNQLTLSPIRSLGGVKDVHLEISYVRPV